ncbi:Bax inhibitor-1 family protein [Mycoplasma marinum]|uniref:Bax inhibitor-1/YccA family protein n=1 Tax=Mycoplasma marinum TaxID=1937190 RepID=UPI003B2FCE5C
MFKSTKSYTSSKTTVLNASLLWFGIGLVSLLGVATVFGLIPQMQDVAITIFSSNFSIVVISIVAFGLMLAISFLVMRVNVSTLVMLYIAFALIEGFMLSIVLMRYAFEDQTWKVLLLFLIPAVTMLVMGYIGYKQIFDFSKIGRFLMFSLIGLILMGLIMAFIPGIGILWTVYSILGYALFTLYVGFDIWRISKVDEVLRMSDNDNDELVLRYGIMFGLSLLVDFIQLVWFLARLIR